MKYLIVNKYLNKYLLKKIFKMLKIILEMFDFISFNEM